MSGTAQNEERKFLIMAKSLLEHNVTVLGDGGVGKTALTIQLCSNHFVEYYDPTIESSYRRQCVVDEQPCLLNILDTAGQDDYSALRVQWIRSGEAFLIVYDITNRSTLDQAAKLRYFRPLLTGARDEVLQVQEGKNPTIMLVGNKIDLEASRQVTTLEGKELAKTWNALFMEASAFTRKNVDEVFFDLVRELRVRNGQHKKEKKFSLKDKLKNKLGKDSCKVL
jgi:GTPase KRas protein